MFNFIHYIEELTNANRLCVRRGYKFCTCSGLGYLEGLLQEMRTSKNFVCVCDICEEATQQRGGAWYKRRAFTVFVLARYDIKNRESQKIAIEECREVQRQFHSRFIVDEGALASRLAYLDTSLVRSRELGGDFLDGCTGLYFTVTIDEPLNLAYDYNLWYNKRIKKSPLPADPKGELNTGEWPNKYQWHEGDKTHPEPIIETGINGTE